MTTTTEPKASSAGAPPDEAWRTTDADLPFRVTSGVWRPEIVEKIEKTIARLDAELRELSLDLHAHPELSFKEHHAHDVLTKFMEKEGFEVERQFHLPTAWRATFSHTGPNSTSKASRTIGVNSEMDALPGVGHACGHNLIAIAGVAVAIAVKEALVEFGMDGKVSLLGTPAEEGGSGKVILLDKGAYKDMAACLMCHPAPGPQGSASLSSCLAINGKKVNFKGHSAHAGLSPWEGVNALDAAVLAYNNVSVLRQQVKPTHRIHGIFHGNEWAANIIPDNSEMTWLVRAPTRAEANALTKRVEPCFHAAALATGCEVDVEEVTRSMYDLRQNKALGDELSTLYQCRYGSVNHGWGISSASTDFGNVSYELPSLHPSFAIPTVPNGGNHTHEFASAAKTPEAHRATLNMCKALAAVGVRVIEDDEFFAQVKETFEEDKKKREDEFEKAGL
ncbi:hypothetical protein BDV98DRAFT_574031 [Pterulicium gracile]|uniref:Peptidase M20 domain-containing protein 2 n=1 Tax=Pterulicium gracile TaxID=1884261 RepID=A0A5C3Q7Y6_9AGAR|nr:hypothetical protein BDV98DRAFT_574031 [Pterula gracilis]